MYIDKKTEFKFNKKGERKMLRTILSFAAGFGIAKLTANSKTVEKIKTTSAKVAKTVKEEFSSKEKNEKTAQE
ncbi:MAG: hypothetical protein CSA18_04255 [Deltaproteobacteria bacterium]|nr:MAG: hypothetical protein CSA18_04255 [Deltaproteobacteria bacterium]